MNSKTWIVISDKNQTRIFEKKKLVKEWEKVSVIANPHQSADKETHHERHGHEHHEHDPYYVTVTDFLNKSRGQNKYADILLVASKEVLGGLRDRFDKETEKLLRKTINKDLAHFNQKELEEYLHDDFLYTGDLHK